MVELSDKEAHCVARLLQSFLFGDYVGDGCQFCKFKCRTEKDPAPHLDEIRIKLMHETGVDLGWGGAAALRPDSFPYRRFLRNSNDEIKEKLRKYFSHCEGFEKLKGTSDIVPSHSLKPEDLGL